MFFTLRNFIDYDNVIVENSSGQEIDQTKPIQNILEVLKIHTIIEADREKRFYEYDEHKVTL